MDTDSNQKKERLFACLKRLDSALVAFSGGVDSAVVLKAAVKILGDRVAAATVRSALSPPGEIETASALAREIRVKHLILDFKPLDIPEIKTNQTTRCYHCKTAIAVKLKAAAAEHGLTDILDGSHAEDETAYRPGSRAIIEAGFISPLKEAGFMKAEVRQLARELSLPAWNRPASPCLATRFPYNTTLTALSLSQVFEAEKLLAECGLTGGRARHHGDILRLELPVELMPRLADKQTRSVLAEGCLKLGFKFITLDLAGYRSGVFDQP